MKLRSLIFVFLMAICFVPILEPGGAPASAAGADDLQKKNAASAVWSSDQTRFLDEFDQSQLSPGWSWVREDPSAWNLIERSGYLRIFTQYGTLDGGIANNILLREVPGPSFEASTKVEFQPTQNYHEACLLLYQDDDNYLRLSRLYNDQHYYLFTWEKNGVRTFNYRIDSSQTMLEMKIIKIEDAAIGLFRDETGAWKTLGKIPLTGEANFPAMGICAHNGIKSQPDSIPADFDSFEAVTFSPSRLYLPLVNRESQ